MNEAAGWPCYQRLISQIHHWIEALIAITRVMILHEQDGGAMTKKNERGNQAGHSRPDPPDSLLTPEITAPASRSPRKFIMKPSPVKVAALQRYAHELNEQQLQAVIHDRGPALVIAGAGSGKTRVLIYRLAWLVEHGIDPSSIMLVTFTKKAADEMISRAKRVSDVNNVLVAGTFHHIAHLYLRKHARAAGFDPHFTILDSDDAIALMRQLRAAALEGRADGNDRKGFPKASTLVHIYSRCMNLHLQVDEVLKRFYPEYKAEEKEIQGILQRYFDKKKQLNVMDFDDLLVHFLRLLRTDGARDQITRSIKHVMVDEYQDVNELQADIVHELGSKADSLMVVGDDAQSIYAFRGADIRHILDFEGIHGRSTARHYLTINYRSTPEILALANASIKHNRAQFPKDLVPTLSPGEKPEVVSCHDKDDEADYVCKRILAAKERGIELPEQAVLFRARFQCLALQRHLLKNGIPYVLRAGTAIYESAHFKDLLSFLIVIDNPRQQVAWTRVFCLVDGIGDATAETLSRWIVSKDAPLDAFHAASFPSDLKGSRVKQAAVPNLIALQRVFKDLLLPANAGLSPSGLMRFFLKYYEPALKRKFEDSWRERLDDLDELIVLMEKYTDLSEMLAETAVSETWEGKHAGKKGPSAVDNKPLVLSTIHQAKGLEWTCVYVIEAREGSFPLRYKENDDDEKESIEEERRLFYVAATRAKHQLVFTCPEKTSRPGNYDRDDMDARSMFLREIESQDVYVAKKSTKQDELDSGAAMMDDDGRIPFGGRGYRGSTPVVFSTASRFDHGTFMHTREKSRTGETSSARGNDKGHDVLAGLPEFFAGGNRVLVRDCLVVKLARKEITVKGATITHYIATIKGGSMAVDGDGDGKPRFEPFNIVMVRLLDGDVQAHAISTGDRISFTGNVKRYASLGLILQDVQGISRLPS